MQYMIESTFKAGAPASELARIIEKFATWSPPEGVEVHGIWSSADKNWALVETDDFTKVAEIVGQFSAGLDLTVHPVVMAEESAPAIGRGLAWATS